MTSCWMLFLFMGLSFLSACQNNDNIGIIEEAEEFRDTTLASIEEEVIPNLTIHQGLVSQTEQTIRVIRGGKAVAIVKISEPKIVAQAETEQEWGFFQFPIIYRAFENDNLIVRWQLKNDSQTAYGEDSYGYMMSTDEGNTWETLDRSYFGKERYWVELQNGNILQVKDPAPQMINNYPIFPNPINTEKIKGTDFYLESELPEDLRGVYFTIWNKRDNTSSNMHGAVFDPGLLRDSSNGLMPIVWWGAIKKLSDGSLVTGIYPTYYQNTDGFVLRSAVSFYKSKDLGHRWDVLGKIPYQTDRSDYEDYIFDGNDGFTEPSFEILKDGTFLCVMRTSSTTPMYKTYSIDGGMNWTKPEPFTPNGVMPNLLLLKNGVLVLASGRPGLQLRFCLDGDGGKWTEPIEMFPFLDEKGNYDIYGTSCGYPCILQENDNTFFLIYSYFKKKNKSGEERKTILFRRVKIII